MSPGRNLYVQDRRYDNPRRSRRSRRPDRGSRNFLLSLALILIAATAAAAVYRYWPGRTTDTTGTTSGQTTASQPGQTTTEALPTATPTPTPPPASANEQLLPEVELAAQEAGTPAEGCSPGERGLVSTIFDNQYGKLSSYSRPSPISLLNPLFYNQIPGVLTFRGTNFRNAPAFGQVTLTARTMRQVWEKPVGSKSSSSWSFSWTGTGWTGQPLLVQWDDDVRNLMNIKDEKKAKPDLIEVIYATMDGNVYFYDLDDGAPTRDPIKIGATIKGTPCVDPRGYPVLYVGQGDKNGSDSSIGFRVYNLVDQSLLLFKECSDGNSYRSKWGACDSSPIFDAAADTLIYPNENGMIYTAKMNTAFDRQTGELTIAPEFSTYRYTMSGMANYGIESSIAIYNHLGFFSDNSGNLNCVDLNALSPVWSRQLADDSDVTPVLEQNGTNVALYTGTEVDWQKNTIGNYLGQAVAYKIDALTGAVVWQASYPCWTKNAADNGDDINGGAMGTPVIGKKDLQDLVIFSFCMTNGIYSGNSLVAYDKSDGSVVWEYKMAQYSWSSPVDIYDEKGHGYILIPDSTGQLHLVDGRTGVMISVLQLTKNGGESAGNIESSCAVFNNRLVIGTRGNVIVGVELE
ncbi:MAG TPA: pyrrolo-quinoline quinone [Clostridiales bacterium]|nr:pyrrolo-quinoline quinone [Clostridiales bacterium]